MGTVAGWDSETKRHVIKYEEEQKDQSAVNAFEKTLELKQ